MNRQIKFRAWDKTEKKMIPAIHIFVNGIGVVWINTRDGLEGIDNLVATENFELMQFTGLQDRNGKDIYEGDIFHLGDKNIKHQVVWNDTGLIGKQIRSSSYVGLDYWKRRIEVIGNINDNPELIK